LKSEVEEITPKKYTDGLINLVSLK
jgi:hypothetical protein